MFVRLIPVYDDDTKSVETAGWSAFEDRLEETHPDWFDPERASVA